MGSPRHKRALLEWDAFTSQGVFPQPRNRTRASCTGRRVLLEPPGSPGDQAFQPLTAGNQLGLTQPVGLKYGIEISPHFRVADHYQPSVFNIIFFLYLIIYITGWGLGLCLEPFL